ncbi:Protein of unknown function [Rhizobiales bacterium GAS191]|jgi:hypothetical protein|nr:Protein of unknown function [Rhizobiales bacterium GAS191]
MIVSLNEIETTILKAARGAGMEWGLAEEAAQAGRWLARRRLAFEVPLLAVLEAEAWRADAWLDGSRRDGVCLRPRRGDAWLCPIRAGAWLSDLGEWAPLRIERVLEPLLLLPFAARRAHPLELSWAGVSVLIGAATFAVRPQDSPSLRAPRAEIVELAASPAAGPPESHDLESLDVLPGRGVSVDLPAWSKLQGFEARTYVPASLESRISGAGAAKSDND